MSGRLDLDRDGADWPHRTASRFVMAGGLRMHVQVMGAGPVILLLHGTGASTHSWRGLLPLLAERFTVVAPDLPGHAFTGDPGMNGLSLKGMARSIKSMLRELDLKPDHAVGHSAGAAILIRMSLDGDIAPQEIISLNGALQPYGGLIGQFFQPIARMLATWPLMTTMFAWRARDPRVIADILKQTGSTLNEDGVALYRRLAENAEHVSAALGMMANWDLQALERDMPRLARPLHLVAASRDDMVKPDVARHAKALVKGATLIPLSGLGHLAHEEDPALLAKLITDIIIGKEFVTRSAPRAMAVAAVSALATEGGHS
jgi:magnesium chelatase accessory protein